MRVKIMAALAAAALAAPAGAADWQGIWAYEPAVCKYKDLVGQHDPAPVRYTATEFTGLENRCDIRAVEKLGEMPAWRLTLSCSGEGTTYEDERLLMISEDGALWEFDGIFEPFRYTRCK